MSYQFVGTSWQFIRKELTVSACKRVGIDSCRSGCCSEPFGTSQSTNVFARLGCIRRCCSVSKSGGGSRTCDGGRETPF